MSLTQHAFYIANQLECILYGVELVLYFKTVSLLLSRRRRRHHSADYTLLALSTALLVLVTIPFSADKVFGEEMWIVNTGYPGGPDAYLEANASVWYETMGTAASVLLNLLGDGLMVYRCHVLYADARIIAVPAFLWVATLALGTAQLYYDALPASASSGSWFAGLAASLGLAYYSASIALNTLCSALIAARIVRVARKTARTLGRELAATYTGALALVVEAALPYTLCGLAFLGAYGAGSGLALLFGDLYVMCTCISPQMIIYRVAAGRAWTSTTTAAPVSSLGFTDGARSAHGRDALPALTTTFRSEFTGTALGEDGAGLEPSSAGPLLSPVSPVTPSEEGKVVGLGAV